MNKFLAKTNVKSSDKNTNTHSGLDLDDVLNGENNSEMNSSEIQIPVDVYEDEKNFYIHICTFGVSSEEITIDLTPESMKIEFLLEPPSIQAEILAKEVEWGLCARSILFPNQVIVADSNATMLNSYTLLITLPKFIKTQNRRLEIN